MHKLVEQVAAAVVQNGVKVEVVEVDDVLRRVRPKSFLFFFSYHQQAVELVF